MLKSVQSSKNRWRILTLSLIELGSPLLLKGVPASLKACDIRPLLRIYHPHQALSVVCWCSSLCEITSSRRRCYADECPGQCFVSQQVFPARRRPRKLRQEAMTSTVFQWFPAVSQRAPVRARLISQQAAAAARHHMVPVKSNEESIAGGWFGFSSIIVFRFLIFTLPCRSA